MSRKSKYLVTVFLAGFVIAAVIFILNIKVNSYQGINYKVRVIKTPLYVKILDLFSRHYHYRELVKEIIGSCKAEDEKVFTLFEWTHKNIRRVPPDFPVIDDHVWNIIIRGYGVSDQSCDVFTTLCNYAGVEAFFTFVNSKQDGKKAPFSFVRIRGRWFVFDPFYGIYFQDNNGNLADIETIKSGIYSLGGHTQTIGMDYSNYIPNFPSIKNMGLVRANIQSPLNRILFEIRKWKKINPNL